MSNDDLREQIEALRLEVRQMSASFANLREEDVRRVFVRQVRPVVEERIDRALGPGTSESKGCREALLAWSEGVLGALEHGGRSEGLRFLERNGARSALRGCPRPELGEVADGLDALMRSYLDSYGAVVGSPTVAGEEVGAVLSPEKVEAALAPLSNMIRISILQHLARDEDGLASLSRALGLQKGHVQFHIRSLLEGGYIEYDRKSRLYALSLRGRKALDGLARLMRDLDS